MPVAYFPAVGEPHRPFGDLLNPSSIPLKELLGLKRHTRKYGKTL